jgi:hypothetical protein
MRITEIVQAKSGRCGSVRIILNQGYKIFRKVHMISRLGLHFLLVRVVCKVTVGINIGLREGR